MWFQIFIWKHHAEYVITVNVFRYRHLKRIRLRQILGAYIKRMFFLSLVCCILSGELLLIVPQRRDFRVLLYFISATGLYGTSRRRTIDKDSTQESSKLIKHESRVVGFVMLRSTAIFISFLYPFLSSFARPYGLCVSAIKRQRLVAKLEPVP